MKKTLHNAQDGTLRYDYEYRCARVAQMQRSNRRVALLALVVAVGLMLASAAYIAWFGGANRGVKPIHSSRDFSFGTNLA